MAEAEREEMETAPDIEMWDWVTGDSIHVDIPVNEQRPQPASEGRSTRFRPRASASTLIPNLSGKLLQAVQEEADRIKLGEHFTSFAEFDRCLQSWCVLNGRGAHRFKTHATMCVRTCRFGKCRPPWRTPQSPVDGHNENQASSGPNQVPADLNETPLLEEEPDLGWQFIDGDWTLTECDPEPAIATASATGAASVPQPASGVPSAIGAATDPEPAIGAASDPQPATGAARAIGAASDPQPATGPASGTGPGSAPQPATGPASGTGPGSAPQPAIGLASAIGAACATTARAPLGTIVHNTLGRRPVDVNHNQVSMPGEALNQAPRSIVKHTSVWLSSRKTKQGRRQVSEVIRQQSQSGACGQLARFEAAPQEPNNNSAADNPCPFRVRCQRHTKSGRCHITICELQHTCPQVRHQWRGPTKKSHWLGETLAPRITRNVKVPVKELVDGFQSDYYKSTSYHQMWRNKDLVRDWYQGGQRKSFHQIPSLLRRLSEIDVGCIVDWSTVHNTDIFKRAFICPSATRPALQYCQPLVALDACHTKNRKFPTQLFLATVLDGNSQVLILCYGVAPIENTENWTWFLEQLDRVVHGIGDPQIALISDRQKGLKAAVKDIFPGKVHAACANHLRANVKTNFGKAAAQFFNGCVYANSKKQYDDILERLVASMAKGVAAKDYIEEINPEVYARHAFPLPRMGRVTSNPAEQANSGLLPLRDFAPFRLLVELWYYVQARFNDRRGKANRSAAQFTNPAISRHNVNLRTYGQWQVFDDGGVMAKVENAAHTEQYLVKLSDRPTCTCFETQEMCWPCEHLMAWDSRDGCDFSLRFHKCWRTSSLRLLYEPLIPCFLSNDFDLCRWCGPPEVAVQKGRHRVVRIRAGGQSSRTTPLGVDERIDSMGNLFMRYPIHDEPLRIEPMPSANLVAGEIRRGSATRRKRANGPNVGKTKCSSCGRAGHNKRRCEKVAAMRAAEATTAGQPEAPSAGQGQSPAATTMVDTFQSELVQDSQMMETVPTIATPTCATAGPSEMHGIPDYGSSSSEEDPPPTGPSIISPGRFGSTQNPTDPDWMAEGLDNWAGVSQVQH